MFTASYVGNELMRDSALKPLASTPSKVCVFSVGNELMRDSALKLSALFAVSTAARVLEMSSCATAL